MISYSLHLQYKEWAHSVFVKKRERGDQSGSHCMGHILTSKNKL